MGVFRFKQFDVDDGDCAMKVGTDSVLLGAWADVSDALTVADLGAGSGLLALMVAQRNPLSEIHAVELDPAAAKAADRNFAASPWTDRLHAIVGDVFDYAPSEPVDLIISNPPYFTSVLRSPDARRAAARHASSSGVANASPSHSLGPVTLLDLASRLLSAEGSLAMVTPADYEDELTWHASLLRLNLWRKCRVLTVAEHPATRVLWQFSRRPHRFEGSELTVRDASQPPSFTSDYIDLTRPFYLNF